MTSIWPTVSTGWRRARPIPSMPSSPILRMPQSFMRQIVRAALPLGEGVVLDPFMGGGSTIAAAIAVGYQSCGVELDLTFFRAAAKAIPALAIWNGNGRTNGTSSVTQQKLALDDES